MQKNAQYAPSHFYSSRESREGGGEGVKSHKV